MKYLEQNGRPTYTPIHVFKEGKVITNEIWLKIFSEPDAPAAVAAAAEVEAEAEAEVEAVPPAPTTFDFGPDAKETVLNSSWYVISRCLPLPSLCLNLRYVIYSRKRL